MQDIRIIATRLKKLDVYQRGLLPFLHVPPEEYLAHLGLRAPDLQANVFAVLGVESIISAGLARRVVGMVRFRNILVQDYLDIDSDLVKGHLEQRLSDFQQFSREIIDQFPALSGDAPESP